MYSQRCFFGKHVLYENEVVPRFISNIKTDCILELHLIYEKKIII